ncbi:MAG: tRNA preQ1(34) S-adenosylmethionine ribosyltransferase-isomerase QueA [Desulfobulbaceae bacterium]|nr:tRNA preQ1(34) S-adenosylmethionine ribosyltransferase-isomerase QueA [Desulfobulbaceae bacterium]
MSDKIPLQYDIESYHYHLPQDRIAQQPADDRDASRLLSFDCTTGSMRDLHFSDIVKFFAPGDLLVVNNTKVFPARILGRKETGGRVELLALEYPQSGTNSSGTVDSTMVHMEVVGLLKSSKRPKPGQRIFFADNFYAEVIEFLSGGKVRLSLFCDGDLDQLLDQYGQMPLPPYIKRPEGQGAQDKERYQTVYASETGAVAAPTAGLHFTPELLDEVAKRDVDLVSVTLHVGYGTFAPVRVQDIREHDIHSEFITVSSAAAAKINKVRKEGGRIWAVGTTTVRALEFAADDAGQVHEKQDWCNLYIFPGYRFKVVENLITNFHLPGSSLLFMVSALAGRENMLACYNHAVEQQYRFFSYGDAMIICSGR